MSESRKLFHATDFQSLMYPCFIVSSILGIFPYKINGLTIEPSRLRYILLTFLTCLFCIEESVMFYKIITKKIDYGNVIRTLEAAAYYIFGGFVTIITYASSDSRMHVLQAMLEISSKLPSQFYQKLSKWIHIKDILGVLFLIIQGCTYYCRIQKYFTDHMLAIYISVLVFQINMQYINCVFVLKACFKKINDALIDLQDAMNKASCVPNDTIYDTQKNQLLLVELKILIKQHLIISNTMHMLNMIFSLQLLATITMTFTEITSETYFHIIRWENGLSIILNDEIRDVFFLLSVAYNMMKLILLVWVYETGKNQAVEINTTVHDVLNCTNNQHIKKELQLFSLQILHCARNTFNTKGFSLDATLLAAMTGNITTYILILAQFMIMSHSCDKIANNIT